MIHKGIKISTGLDWNKDRFQKDIASYKDSTELFIDVTDKKPSKTLEQIRLIHLLIGYIAEHTGYTIEQAKVVIKDRREYYQDFSHKETCQLYRVYKSFRNLNLDDATDWIKYLLDLCEALGIRVKCPNCFKSVSAGEIIKDKETKKLYCKFCIPKGVTQ